MATSVFLGITLAVNSVSAAGQVLAPDNDIQLPLGKYASNPLEWLGANSPYFAGPNVNNISPEVPENCYIDGAAYIVRHGSRYPDSSAYEGWVSMYDRFSAGDYAAKGALSFLPDWSPVLTNTDLQMSMESHTGTKEAQDLGYQLRTRYPQLYNDGTWFPVWANNYTRVLQTAAAFVQGYLGFTAAENGTVVSVTSKIYPDAIGNSLSPSDQCPNFYDSSGGAPYAEWNDIWTDPVMKRLQALIKGNLTLTASDIEQFPYLCGFESQITGKLSPFCDINTEEELKQYEYSNDLRYYYGLGPGTVLEQTMMLPYLNSLINLLVKGPGVTGKNVDGTTFDVPGLLMTFLNDGQLVELVTASGVFDHDVNLTGTHMPERRLFIASHFVTMRGTLAFERLNCLVDGSTIPSRSTSSTTSAFAHHSPTTLSTSVRGAAATKVTTEAVISPTFSTKGKSAQTTNPKIVSRKAVNATYVRIRLNDAVYPLPSCQDGPGLSCLLSEYQDYIGKKYAKSGDWLTNCNVTTAAAPTVVQGASFYTNLASDFLQQLPPY